MSGICSVRIIVESSNDNDHQAGNKRVLVYNYNGLYDNIPLGRVYCEDPDDWDLGDKTFEFYPASYEGFE